MWEPQAVVALFVQRLYSVQQSVQSVHGPDYLTKERVVSKLSSSSQHTLSLASPHLSPLRVLEVRTVSRGKSEAQQAG